MSEGAIYTQEASLSLREAVFRTFKIMGLSIIESAPRFVGCVLDLTTDDAPIVHAFELNCDTVFLDFYKAVLPKPTEQTLDNAIRHAAVLLEHKRLLNRGAAQKIAAEVGFALGLYVHTSCSQEVRDWATEQREVYPYAADGQPNGSQWQDAALDELKPAKEDEVCEDSNKLRGYEVTVGVLCFVNCLVVFNAIPEVAILQHTELLFVAGLLGIIMCVITLAMLLNAFSKMYHAGMAFVATAMLALLPWGECFEWCSFQAETLGRQVVPLQVWPDGYYQTSLIVYTLFEIFLLMYVLVYARKYNRLFYS